MMTEPGISIFVVTAVVLFGALLMAMAEGFLRERDEQVQEEEEENDKY